MTEKGKYYPTDNKKIPIFAEREPFIYLCFLFRTIGETMFSEKLKAYSGVFRILNSISCFRPYARSRDR